MSQLDDEAIRSLERSNAQGHIGFVVKDLNVLAQRTDVKHVHYMSTNVNGTMWVTAVVDNINELRKDPNVIHIESTKPIGPRKRTGVENLY